MLKSIMILAALFGVLWTLRKPKGVPAIITLVMVLGILVALWHTQIGIYIYLVAVLLAFVYGIFGRLSSMGSRAVILLMSTSIFAYWLWVTMHWHGNANVAPILTLIVAVTASITKPDLKLEFGFLGILTLDAVAILVENYWKAYS